jgi:hypothetical protein
VRPYQPAGLWEEKSGAKYQPDTGDGLYRRSLYTIWKRTSPPPAMSALGASHREVCAARRHAAPSPLSALVLLNDPQTVEACRVFAENLLRSEPDDTARLRAAFRRLTSRGPTESELAVLVQALEAQRAHVRAAPPRARALVAVGARPPAVDLDPIETASLAMVVNLLCNFDETVRLQ